MKAPSPTKPKRPTFQPEMYVRAFRLAETGMPRKSIAQVLGITDGTLKSWADRHPALKNAIREGWEKYHRSGLGDFLNYVLANVSPEVRELWQKLLAVDLDPSKALERIRELHNSPRAQRQQIFVLAMIKTHFKPSLACRFAGITFPDYVRWKARDPTFQLMLEELEWHKKNYYEDGLLDLVSIRDSPAVLLANKTYNRDRGYNEKIEVTHSGQINHVHAVIDIEALDLPLAVRRVLLAAVEKADECRELTSTV